LIALLAALRVFSADYCADQYVLALAPRAEIASLSRDAAKDFSHLREEARGLPRARPDVEAAIASGADVVIRFWGGDARAFERAGMRVVTLPYADDFEGVKAALRAAGAGLAQQAGAESLIRDMDRSLSALAARGPSGRVGLYLTPGGVTAGSQTLIDAMFNAAGVGNATAMAGLSYWPPLSTEMILRDPPTFYVGGFFNAASERNDNWSAARHPALRRVLAQTPGIILPPDLIACPAWFAVEAAELIRNAADQTIERRAP
jgi:iron complex transport system substrate-binding protein